MSSHPDLPLLSSAGAGRLIGVGPSRVAQLEREGKLPAVRDSAGRRLFRESDVWRFMKTRQEATVTKTGNVDVARG